MIVVADTGPINYLTLIDACGCLAQLYGEVVIPRAVADELCSAVAPEVVRRLMSNLPTWLLIRDAPPPDASLEHLDPGERHAISLAVQLGADLLLVDDLDARAAAREHGIRVTGTLGVLRDAALAGLLRIEEAVARLHETNFRLSETLAQQVIAWVRVRQKDSGAG